MKKTLLITLLLVMSGCTAARKANQGTVHHVVLCWLKDSGNAAQRSQIIEASRSFAEIPGVVDVRVGEAIESDRKIVDDSFDVAIFVTLADMESMAAYLSHPIHEKAKTEILLPVIDRILVYDFKD